MKALLFSGGIDSTCIAWQERPDRLVFIDYGQMPAKGELRASTAIAQELEIPLKVLTADLRAFGAGTMAGAEAVVGAKAEFWPYRNQMLITLAVMAFAQEPLTELMIGTVRTDRQHSDGRAAFLKSMSRVLESQNELTLSAPAFALTTEQLIVRSGLPPDLLGWTFSCHTGEWACGQCGGCEKHLAAKARLAAPPTEQQ